MKHRNVVAGAVGIVALVFFGMILGGNFSNSGTGNTVSNSTDNSSPKTVTVEISDSGFNPISVTISSGDTVQFTNGGSSLHWPASNPHPQHTDYPGFDALHGLAPGESYSFTFTRIGTWGYHDHLNPSLGGTIIVQ